MPETQGSTLAKVYSPHDVESKWYAEWEKSGVFHANVNPQLPPYTIVIPPPNVTGVLHMGHILNNTMQDALVRYKRMTGYEACWIPGMDHAGIATQHVVERALEKEGGSRLVLGREKFVERVWAWKEQYGGVIIRQLRTLGASCDWEREKFTMDETLSAAVREVFVRLYEEGLIYRGKYIVNWCPKDHTAISDDEVNHADHQGHLYHIRYPLKGAGGQTVTVATTRPETMLGDTALAVHPKDERYRQLVGATAVVPLVEREVPIIADDYVEPEFGTGIVKVTPAHDPNDYWIGDRHHLPQINIFDTSAAINENAPAKYRGLDRYEARRRILADLQTAGLLEKTENHVSAIGRCYRCDTVIEPYLSDQWFVRMKPLAAPALEVVADGTIRFFPDRWAKVYEHWMTNIRDWCISRQLWWGHRIPVWYCLAKRTPACTEPIVRRTAPESCPHCHGGELRQDDDVLDTWFSSWLWPFSVHDWPDQARTGKKADLTYFYPTSALVTAPEIIFFWVARMIMAGLKFGPSFTGSTDPVRNIPFRDVYFTSTVRDDKGRKMSKSLGNSPEPLDLIEEYGADAVRFTILFLAPVGQDITYAKEKNEIGRNFANKIWNAGRFLLLNRDQLGEAERRAPFNTAHADLADQWILSRLHSTLRDVQTAYEGYEFNRVVKTIYDFIWHDYCDWYLEMIKSRLYGEEAPAVKSAVITRALDVFDAALQLLHPVMPFITEELYQFLRARGSDRIIRSQIPAADPRLIDANAERQMAFVQQVIESIRNIRGEMSIGPSKEIALVMRASTGHPASEIRKYEGYLQRLARVTSLSFLESPARPGMSATAVVEGEELFVPLEGVIDLAVERARLQKEIDRVDAMLNGIRTKLGNANFIARAPEDVVAKEREKETTFETHLVKLRRSLQQILPETDRSGSRS
ncbi:MAG TPA: valine--tRNA ligase [Bacteroidota bacterium]|nr:valine--tRNA ligase [Bacteroidota bacterium]